MSKKKTKKSKQKPKAIKSEHQAQQPPPPPANKIVTIRDLGWRSIVALATILSLIPLYFYLYALSMSATQFSSDLNDPLSHVFTIKNTFVLPIYNVYAECAINLSVDGKPTFTNVIGSEIDHVQNLGALENFDTMCP